MTVNSGDSNVALITGANKGIGREIARQLGARGITVLVAGRDEQQGRTAVAQLCDAQIAARFVRLDVTEPATIEATAYYVDQAFGKLDILVNNAGIQIDHGLPRRLNLDVMRRTYETNVFGVFAVTTAMLPLLRRSDAGRIVNISSVLASLTPTGEPSSPWSKGAFRHFAYNSSKTAVNALTVQFANELRDTPIKVNSVSPGYVATDLNNFRGSRTVQQGAATPVRLALLPADGSMGAFFDDDGPLP